ncbi:Rmf/CrpP family protein [Jiella sp. M17.18]|uniref:ribosome modulation factor n=1 Tax=Jiella sp. M17.18 TaxID=3234247 RepID=UPI0034DE3D68
MATDAYQQGKLAYQNNYPMSGCSYPVDSTLRAEWMRGWNEARNADPATGGSGERSGMMGDARKASHIDERHVRQS